MNFSQFSTFFLPKNCLLQPNKKYYYFHCWSGGRQLPVDGFSCVPPASRVQFPPTNCQSPRGAEDAQLAKGILVRIEMGCVGNKNLRKFYCKSLFIYLYF